MASRTNHSQVSHELSEVELLTAHFTGGGAADMVAVYGDVLTAVRTGAGVFNLTFKKKYPQKLVPFDPGIVGTTVGLGAVFTAWDPAAGTATVAFSVGAVATDPATTDNVHFAFLVRNSGRNPATV